MEMNESEKKFKEWLDNTYNTFVFIDQTSVSQSEDFKKKVARPDFFIKLDNNRLIAVDVKKRTLNPKFKTFKLKRINQDRLASFEMIFKIPVWVAFTTEANELKVWHWISINEIATIGKLIKIRNRNFWTIGIEHCDTLEWNDNLDKIASKIPQKTELMTAHQDVLNEVSKIMESKDTELKKLIRQRRLEQKKLEKRIENVERDYMVKPTVFLKQIQKDITEKVSETVKKMKERLDKTFNTD